MKEKSSMFKFEEDDLKREGMLNEILKSKDCQLNFWAGESAYINCKEDK